MGFKKGNTLWKVNIKPKLKKNCLHCYKEFNVVPSQQKRKTCSYQCRQYYLNKDKNYRVHMSEIHTKHGKYLYRKLALGFYGEICSKCNAEDVWLDVHHIDGNRYNNFINNLQVLCKSCHLKIIHSGEHMPSCEVMINTKGMTY